MTAAVSRQQFVRRGEKLEYFTVAWNSLEASVSIVAGVFASSVSLIGFGLDSLIEVTSGARMGKKVMRLPCDGTSGGRPVAPCSARGPYGCR